MGGLTVELPTDNSTAAHKVVTGVVCNPRHSLHFTIDEGRHPGEHAPSLVRFIFYHNERTARATDIQGYPSGELKERSPLTCNVCGVEVQSPHIDPDNWLHHFDAACDTARGEAWNCGCGRGQSGRL